MSDRILNFPVAASLAGASFVIAKAGLNEQVLASDFKALLSLDQVNNTSDANKPVSNAQAAINAALVVVDVSLQSQIDALASPNQSMNYLLKSFYGGL